MTECPILKEPSWWIKNIKYIVIAVGILIFLMICFYVNRTIKSYHRQLQNLTMVVAEQQLQLNKYTKTTTTLEEDVNIEDIIENKDPNVLTETFSITPSIPTPPPSPIVLEEEKEESIDVEAELAEELKELEENSIVEN